MSSITGGRIPEGFIQSVLSKTDVVALIQESVPLKRKGTNYGACCPFHQEKTPSFSVSQTKQFYHCFGCGAHGDAIAFLMQHQALSFVDALERLATRVGLTVPKDPQESAHIQEKLSLSKVLNRAAEFYQAQWKQKPATAAIAYLKKRGLTGKIAKTFALGFAPPGWNNLLAHFQSDLEALPVLEETGLIIKHPEGRLYDRFRDRILFPIRDRRGDVIGFGGRVIDQGQPKYLNSPESRVFQKGHCLYGIYEALQMRSKWQAAIIVEGYLDVVALAQSEVYGAFATQGTAISAHHLTSVFQLTTELVFCFDGDKAGQGAAWKALELVLPLLTSERQVRFAFLPKGEDPDSYIRQSGGPAFLALIQRSTPLSEYFFSHLCQKIPPDSLDNRARLVNLARPLIEQIPAGVFKEMMFEELAKYAQSTTQVVHGEKAPRELRDNPRRPYKQNNYYPPNKQAPAQPLASAAYITSALLIRHPIFLPLVKEEIARLQDLSVAGIELLRFLLQLLENNPALTKLEIHQQLQESGFTLKRLENCDSKLALIPEQGWEAELRGSIARLVAIGQQQLAEKLLQKSKISDLTPEEKLLLVETLQFRESN